jgi:hypothetical protein
MLVLKDEYRSGFSKFLREVSAGTPTDEALSKIYGKTVDQVGHELDSYLHGTQFKAIRAQLAQARFVGAMLLDGFLTVDRLAIEEREFACRKG